MPKVRLLLCLLLPSLWQLPLLASNYIPLATVPEWEETGVTYDLWTGDVTRTRTRNLRGANNAMRIINGFSGNTYFHSINLTESEFFPFPRTDGYSDVSLTPDGIFRWGERGIVYSTVGGAPTDAAWGYENRVTWGRRLDGVTTPGVLSEPRMATIGVVTLYEYRSTNIAEIPGDVLTELFGGVETGADKQIQTSNDNVSVRSVYAGFDTVNGLFQGSDPLLVTPPYKALVRITETTTEGVNITESFGGDFLPPYLESTYGPTSATVVDWLVDGIGSVRSVVILGEYLDDILNAPIFDSGDGVVAAQTLEELVGGSFDIEILRASGGSLLTARDAVAVDGKVELMGDYNIPPAPDFRGWWYPDLAVGGNWFQVDALGGFIYIPEGMQLVEATNGWVVHFEMGDLYILGGSDQSLWIYNPTLGWTWTANGTYPFFYISGVNQWTSFAYGNGTRYYYSFPRQAWFTEAQILASGLSVFGE